MTLPKAKGNIPLALTLPFLAPLFVVPAAHVELLVGVPLQAIQESHYSRYLLFNPFLHIRFVIFGNGIIVNTRKYNVA